MEINSFALCKLTWVHEIKCISESCVFVYNQNEFPYQEHRPQVSKLNFHPIMTVCQGCISVHGVGGWQNTGTSMDAADSLGYWLSVHTISYCTCLTGTIRLLEVFQISVPRWHHSQQHGKTVHFSCHAQDCGTLRGPPAWTPLMIFPLHLSHAPFPSLAQERWHQTLLCLSQV